MSNSDQSFIPEVSVVIPCHNGAPWIDQAVTSALGQTGVRVEVIVVNDGSTDDSAKRLAAFGPCIQTLQSSDRGGNHARNLGLKHARGQWVQFLDADDELLPDKIFRQLAEAGNAAAAADVLYSPVIIETWNQGVRSGGQSTPIETEADLFTQWITWQLPQTGGALWRRDALSTLGGWRADQPCCQEHELYLRALQAGLRFQLCPTPGAVYRIWSETTVCRRDPLLVIREKTKLIDNLLVWLESSGRLKPTHQAAAGQVCFEMARTWASHDLDAAASYHVDRKAHGLFRPNGQAAPASYRLMLRLLGFRRTEQLARALRSRND